MEAIILQGGSKSDTRLLIELARKLNFKAKKLSSEEMEEMGILLSIHEGIESGLLDEKEEKDFLNRLKEEE